jgi:hypothetical protein
MYLELWKFKYGGFGEKLVGAEWHDMQHVIPR